MQQVATIGNLPKLPFHVLSSRLPIFVVVSVFMMASFTTINIGSLFLARHTDAINDPFVFYADIWPGQPRTAITKRGFTCPKSSITAYHGPDEYCVLMPKTGTFSQVGVFVSNGMIRETTFSLRDDRLKVGNLITLWGIPEVMSQNSAVNCFWFAYKISVSAACYIDGRVSMFRTIQTVYFSKMKRTE